MLLRKSTEIMDCSPHQALGTLPPMSLSPLIVLILQVSAPSVSGEPGAPGASALSPAALGARGGDTGCSHTQQAGQ